MSCSPRGDLTSRDRSGEAEVIFLNVENGQAESITLYPQGGHIGVSGVAVPVE